MEQVHATCVAVEGLGVLIRGSPGAGKSDLALRLIDAGARLVSDDRVNVEKRDAAVIASSPKEINGLLEVRGVGILELGGMEETPLGLVIDLAGHDEIERLPGPGTAGVLDVALPLIRLCPFEASAPAKVRLAVRRALGDIKGVAALEETAP